MLRLTTLTDPHMSRFLVLEPALRSQTRTGLSFPGLSVGRHPSNDFVVESRGVLNLAISRYAGNLRCDGEQYYVEDAGGTNGTYVRAPLFCASEVA